MPLLSNPPTLDSAYIRDKWRQPVNIHTPESHDADNRRALAKELRARGIARELEYIVGSHAYVVTENIKGERSAPSKIF